MKRLAVAVVLLAILAGCSKQEIPASRPMPPLKAWLPYSGKSMLPVYPERGLAEVELGVPFSALKAGDIVVFWDYTRAADRFTLHKLVAKQGGNWIAQGVNPETNPVADRPWVTPENYVCRATGRHAQIVVGQ